MKRYPLITIFATNLIVLAVGNGLFPLLPIFAGTFGATPRLIGLYLALVSASITAGALLSGYLPERLSRRQLLIGGSSLGVPALLLLSGATSLWQVILLTCLLWFSGGICLALSSVYTGLLSHTQTRGRTFSLVALSTPCGLLVGGLLVGGLVEWWGYPATFQALALLWATLPGIFAIVLPDMPSAAQPDRHNEPVPARPAQRWPLFLLAGALLSAASISVSQLGASLVMQALVFSPAAIASTTTAAGLAMFPIMLLLGIFSDRLGRRGFLLLGYLLTAGGIIALSSSTALWQFWGAMALLRVGQAVNDAMAPALATDLLPVEALGHYLPRLKATNWLAGMLSFAGAGYVIGQFGTRPVFVLAAAFAVVAAGLLTRLPASRRIILQRRPSL